MNDESSANLACMLRRRNYYEKIWRDDWKEKVRGAEEDLYEQYPVKANS